MKITSGISIVGAALRDGTRLTLKTGIVVLALQLSGAGSLQQALADQPGETAPFEVQDQIWSEFQGEIGSAKQIMMSDPATALQHAEKAGNLAEHFTTSNLKRESIATGLWLQSEALTRVNRIPEALPLLYRALELVGENDVETKLSGDLRLSLSRASRQIGDIDVALKSLYRAHEIFASLGETRAQSMVLQGMGSIFSDARSFDRALGYFEKANEVYPSDPSLELSATNNAAHILKEMGKYEASLEKFSRALAIASKMESPLLQGRIQTNIASLQTLNGDLDAAEESAAHALDLMESSGNTGWSNFVWGVRAQIALARREEAVAKVYIDTAFEDIDTSSTTASWRDAHEIAYQVYQANGLYVQSLSHLEAFKRLDDRGREVTAKASHAVASANFDFASQEMRYENLKKDQVRSNAELVSLRAHSKLVNLLIVFAGAVFMLMLGYSLVSRRQSADQG